MNKNLYRLVFNRARGFIIPVAENICAQGRASSGAGQVATRPLARDSALALKPLLAFVGLALGMIGFVTAHAAGIVADSGAPNSQQPTVLNAANGVPLVNIQTPSTAGVSRNVYTQFDVAAQGVILNNSAGNVPTQLGGWVQGNPWLVGGTARVILNEINASNPSQLNGYIEVAGSRAQVVIANPAGISCNGCGFINASRATLTTGTPIMNGGSLEGYVVRGGTVSIGGNGLDTRGADYTDIIARAVEINAGLWANDLRVTTGANRVDAGNTQATPTSGTGSTPSFAVDVAQLGGMYSGKIHLIGTESGVGVRNAGTIGASVGEVAITADGQLVNSGSISGATGNAITAQAISNTGEILSGGVLDIASATLTNRGLINGGETAIVATTLDNLGTGRIYGDHLAIAAGTLTNTAETVNGTTNAPVIAARERLDLGVGTLANNAGGLIFSAGDMAIGGSLDANRQATGTAGSLSNTSAAIEALGSLTLDADVLVNQRTEFTTSRILSPDLPEGLALLPYNPALEFFWPYDETNPENWRNFVRDQYINSIANLLGGTLDSSYRSQLEALVNAQPRSVYEDSIDVWNLLLNKINADHPEYINTMAAALSGQSFPLRSYEQECDDTECDYVNYIVKQRTDYKDIVTSSAPAATILADGNSTLNIGSFTNAYSSIEAGGDMMLTGNTLANTGAELFLQTDTITTTHRLHWVDRDHGTTTSSSSTSTLIGSAPGIVSAGGDLTGSYADRIDNLTIRENTAPLTAVSGATPALPGNVAGGGGSLFRTAPGTTTSYLIETDPRFASYRTWLSSDFMQQQLSFDPAITQKRLGDGFYEQRLVREQIGQLTGRRFLTGYASDEAQYRALMVSALTVADSLELIPGVALSAAQMAQLTSDIVWLVQQEVTLPDGTETLALVPRVYIRPQAGDLTPSGALLAGQNVHLEVADAAGNSTGRIVTSGTIAGRNVVTLDAAHVDNLRGLVTGRDVAVAATQDLTLDGGSIAAEDRLIATAGRDLTIKSSTTDLDVRAATETNGVTARVQSHVIDRVAGLYVSNPDALLVASAGQDLNLMAAVIRNSGDDRDATRGGTTLSAGRDLNLGTVTERGQSSATTKNSWRKESWTTQTGSTIQTTGDVTLSAQRDLTATAAQVTSDKGTIVAQAGEDLTLTAGTDTASSDAYRKIKKSGSFGSSKTQHWDSSDQTTHTGTTVSGESVTLTAGNATPSGHLKIAGSQVVATDDVTLKASGDVTITTVADSYTESHLTKKSGSGFSAGAGSLSYGTQKLRTTDDTQQVVNRGSTVGSLEGDVTIAAGKTYSQSGSDVLALEGDIDITAKRVDITAATDTTTHAQTTKFKQTGVTLAISNPVLSAVQTGMQMATAASQTDDQRMQVLAAGTVGLAASNAYDAVSAGQPDQYGNVPTAGNTGAGDMEHVREGTAADQVGGINLSLSLGTSQSSSQSTQTSTTAVGSRVQAGGTITITAMGAGQESDVNIIGSEINAGQDISIKADDDINLIAAQNTSTLDSSNQNSSASVGVSYGTNGLLFTAGGSLGRGNADGSDISWTETQIEAGNKVTLQSGADTNLMGAQVRGDQVIANVGTSGQGNLTLQSLQDTSTYDSDQKTLGGSLSVGAGQWSGSLNYEGRNTESDYASVIEQTGILAGDGGFQINVAGNTGLQGAVIASSENAVTNHNNVLTTQTLTVSNIENHANADVDASGFGVDSGLLSGSKYSVVKALAEGLLAGSEASESASSTTLSAIEMGALQIQDNARQQVVAGETVAETIAGLNRDTTNTNQLLERIDVEALEKAVQAERLIEQASYNVAVKFTDEAFRTMFLKEATVNVILKDENGNTLYDDNGKPLFRALTLEEKLNLQAGSDGKIHITNNGINNTIEAAAKYADQHSTAQDGPQYFIYFPIADNGLSELLIAGYQKFLENQYTGLTNATAETINIMEQYGQSGLHIDGHSRGGLTTGNALEFLNSQGATGSLSNSTIYLFGSAYNALQADNLLATLQNRDSITDSSLLNSMVVQQQTHQADFVGYLLGGNPATGGTIPEGSSFVEETIRIMGGQNTVHSCYMSGDDACLGLWGGSVPVLTPVGGVIR